MCRGGPADDPDAEAAPGKTANAAARTPTTAAARAQRDALRRRLNMSPPLVLGPCRWRLIAYGRCAQATAATAHPWRAPPGDRAATGGSTGAGPTRGTP